MSPRKLAQNSPLHPSLTELVRLVPTWHSSKHQRKQPTSCSGFHTAKTVKNRPRSQSRRSIHMPLDVSSYEWMDPNHSIRTGTVIYTTQFCHVVASSTGMTNSHRVGLAGRVILQVCTHCSLQLLELRQVLLQQKWRYQVSPLKLGAVEVEREEKQILNH